MKSKLPTLFKKLFLGISIKTIGYLIIASGIFISIKDKDIAFKMMIIGAVLVVLGWILIIRALRGE
ncbi:MAG TPA: hypothetical protein EYH04_00175 [Archaeoglobus profundus]|nr:hypothetical protein [Archaeoglobus profundus]